MIRQVGHEQWNLHIDKNVLKIASKLREGVEACRALRTENEWNHVENAVVQRKADYSETTKLSGVHVYVNGYCVVVQLTRI
jgi:hypothetical protein